MNFCFVTKTNESTSAGNSKSILSLHSTILIFGRILGIWLLLLLLGLIIMAGRYEWAQGLTAYSRRSFLLSAYLFLIFIPTLYYLLGYYFKSQRLQMWVTLGIGILFTLPYHVLGLRKYYYDLRYPLLTHWNTLPPPKLDWFPQALQSLPAVPYEGILFAFLLGIGIVATTLYFGNPIHSKEIRKKWFLAFAVFSLILIQTWLHQSLRSPYTYIPHFEQPARKNYWYHYYMFPEGKGAINMDYVVFRPAEALFIGVHENTRVLLSRVFPAYIASQFSQFIHSYYVWIVLNVMAWSLAVISIYYLCSKLFEKRAAFFSALLMASDQGIILYVAQPKIYVFAIAGVTILLAIQHRLFEKKHFSPASAFVFAGTLSLFLLCYEAHPWLVTFACIALTLKLNLFWSLISLGMGFSLYQIFLKYGATLPHLVSFPALAAAPSQHPLEFIQANIIRLNYHWLIVLGWRSIWGFLENLVHVFHLSLIPTFLGLFFIRDKIKKKFLFCLFIPAFATYSLMELGDSFYITLCRLVYSAYPAIYMSSGVALAALSHRWRPLVFPRMGTYLAGSFILVHLIFVNLDVWGFPWIYYLWFYRNPDFSFQ